MGGDSIPARLFCSFVKKTLSQEGKHSKFQHYLDVCIELLKKLPLLGRKILFITIVDLSSVEF